MESGARKRFEGGHLSAELTALKIELLSAQCAMDRIRLKYSPQDIVAFGERETLKRTIASADALHRFCSQIGAQIVQQEEETRGE